MGKGVADDRVEGGGSADSDGVSRRALLGVGLFAATGGITTAVGIVTASSVVGARPTLGPSPAVAASRGGTRAVAVAVPVPAPAPIAEPVPHVPVVKAARPRPIRMHTWAQPVARLDDTVARQVGMTVPRRAIMLTIDDGPHPVWTPRYLRLLGKYHIRATFNVIGEQVRANAALLRAMAGEGHDIGNHTFHHPLDLPSLSAGRIRRELEDTTDAIVRACGYRPRQFRAPGGVWGPDVFAEVGRQQMLPLGWDIDPRDWALPGVAEIQRAMLAARPHDIVLCHDGGGNRAQTYRALETVLPALLARGYEFVTLPAPQ